MVQDQWSRLLLCLDMWVQLLVSDLLAISSHGSSSPWSEFGETPEDVRRWSIDLSLNSGLLQKNPLWNRNMLIRDQSYEEPSFLFKYNQTKAFLTRSTKPFLAFKIVDQLFCIRLIGPKVWDSKPQLLMAWCWLVVIWQHNLIAWWPQTPQGQ